MTVLSDFEDQKNDFEQKMSVAQSEIESLKISQTRIPELETESSRLKSEMENLKTDFEKISLEKDELISDRNQLSEKIEKVENLAADAFCL